MKSLTSNGSPPVKTVVTNGETVSSGLTPDKAADGSGDCDGGDDSNGGENSNGGDDSIDVHNGSDVSGTSASSKRKGGVQKEVQKLRKENKKNEKTCTYQICHCMYFGQKSC
jgi:hypothetical protein